MNTCATTPSGSSARARSRCCCASRSKVCSDTSPLFPVFRDELVSTALEEAVSTRLGCFGWRWHPSPSQIVPVADKGGPRTYAARSCLGTEVTEGSCIARVGVFKQKGRIKIRDPHSSSSSRASRSRPAIASDSTSSRTSDSRCNRTVRATANVPPEG